MLEGQVKWLKNRGTMHYAILSLLMFIFVFSVFGCIVYDYMINGRINEAGIFIVVTAFFLLLFPYTIYMFVIIPKCVGFSSKGFYLKWVYKEKFVPWAMIGTSESFLIPWGRFGILPIGNSNIIYLKDGSKIDVTGIRSEILKEVWTEISERQKQVKQELRKGMQIQTVEQGPARIRKLKRRMFYLPVVLLVTLVVCEAVLGRGIWIAFIGLPLGIGLIILYLLSYRKVDRLLRKRAMSGILQPSTKKREKDIKGGFKEDKKSYQKSLLFYQR